MGRYMRKCRRIPEATVMEVTQVVGVRTRARTLAMAAAATPPEEEEIKGGTLKRRKETAAGGSEAGELEMAYLQLRSRSLVMTQRFSRSGRNSDGKQRGGVERGRISRCSSIASCDAVEGDENLWRSFAACEKTGEDLWSGVCQFECNRSEIVVSGNQVMHSGEIESTAERESQRQQLSMPSEEELEEFFAAAEKSEKQIFATRYNFDVDSEVPLEGRYEWVRIN